MVNNQKKKTNVSRETKRWTDISGDMYIFGNSFKVGKGKNARDVIRYSTSVGKKLEDVDEFVNCYFKVGFKKDNDPEIIGKFGIKVKEGFITVETWENKDGDRIVQPKVVIIDYDFMDDEE